MHILGAHSKIAVLLSQWYITKNAGNVLKRLLHNPVWLHVPEHLASKAAGRVDQAFRSATMAS